MKRAFKVTLALFLIVVIAIVVILNSFGGKVIQQAVNVAGPAALGVPVSLEDADFQLLRGNILLKGLKVGNPEGYKTDSLFALDLLRVDLDPRSLLSGLVHVREILIQDPRITYERGLTSSNLGDLLAGLEGQPDEAPAPAEQPEAKSAEPPAAPEGGARVIIDALHINGAQLNVSLTVAQGLSAPIPLPPISLQDIGKESGGASLMEVITRVVKAILGTVTSALTGSAKLLGEGAALVGEGVMAAGGAAVEGAAAVGDVAVDGAKAVGHGAAVVGGAAVDGAAAVGDVAVDGAKAVGHGAAVVGGAAVDGVKAVGKGMGAVVDGLGGLLGGEEKPEEAPRPAE